jgi:hypothetical protein
MLQRRFSKAMIEISDFQADIGTRILNAIVDAAKRHGELSAERVNGTAMSGVGAVTAMIVEGDPRIKGSGEMQMAMGFDADLKGRMERCARSIIRADNAVERQRRSGFNRVIDVCRD